MRKGDDIAVQFPGLYLVHQNLPGKTVARHDHSEHILFVPLQGEISLHLDSVKLQAGPGRMIYLPPGTHHSFDSSSMLGERLIAILDPDAWDKAGGGTRPLGVFSASQLVKELLFYLLLHPKTRHGSSLIATLIQTLGETLEVVTSDSLPHLLGKAQDARLRKALELMGEDTSLELSLSELARRSGLSVRTLNRLFLDELGLTPKRVLTLNRVTKASALLLSGVSVTETAWEVGYQSLAQFISVFRQHTGQLPSEFAKYGALPTPKRSRGQKP